MTPWHLARLPWAEHSLWARPHYLGLTPGLETGRPLIVSLTWLTIDGGLEPKLAFPREMSHLSHKQSSNFQFGAVDNSFVGRSRAYSYIHLRCDPFFRIDNKGPCAPRMNFAQTLRYVSNRLR